jgi:hypothetical protein
LSTISRPHQLYPGFSPAGEDAPNFTPTTTSNDRGSGVFDWIIEGKVTREEGWDAYLDTLRWGLDDVALLLANLDADEVVITADHAELFGEWRLYGHPIRTWVPALLRVPWVRVSATDTGSYEPSDAVIDENDAADVEEQLRALGYR